MRKILTTILIGSIICFNTSFAYTKIYDMKSNEVPVASGVSYKNLKRLTTEGWLNINILKVDLDNEYVKLDVLTSNKGLSNLETVKNQATNANAVAAINADFFSWSNGKSSGYPIGFMIKNGEIISSAYYKNSVTDTMASFLLDSKKSPLYGYIKMEGITISNENGESMNVAEINKISSDYLIPVMFNSAYGAKSPGNSTHWDMVEFVIEDNNLIEIRDCKEGVKIPENGYVICARLDNAYKIKCMFNIGDKVNLDIKTNIGASNIETAISGGAILVKEGTVLTNHTHNISGYQPRTALGTSKDGKTLYLVAVDGRGISKGVTQVELSYLMKEIGAYNALNLDGGGSTNMVGRLPGTDYLSILNVPTENRKVLNSLGVISTAPGSGKVKDLIIESEYSAIFEGYETKLNVTAYDEYINKVEVDTGDIKWKVSGVKGSVKNGIFKPQTSGVATLTATYKGASHSIEIKVLGDIGEIDTETREITLLEDQEYKIPISVKDVYGYTAFYEAKDFNFTTSNNNCVVSDDGVIIAKKVGSTLVTILSKGNTAKAFIKVNITGEYKEVINDFEKLDVSYKGYPEDIEGDVTLSTKEHKGEKSLKLSYDFTEIDGTKCAYAVFEEPILVDKDTIKINFWAYSKKSQPTVLLKAQITDSLGNKKLIEVSKGIEKDWNEYEVFLDNLELPGTLDRIYVADIEEESTVNNYILVDDLVFTKKNTPQNSQIVLPNNTKPIDLTNREEEVKDGGFRFMFYGNVNGEGTLYDNMKINRLANVASGMEFCILGNGELPIEKDQILINGKYSFYEKDELAVLKLANNGKGILATYKDQWNWLVNKLNSTNSKNLLVVMPHDVENSFSDEQEKILFKQVLAEYEEKNDATVTFLVLGEESEFSMYEGTKTIIAGSEIFDTVRARIYHDKYIVFTANGEELTYQILNVF